MSNNITFTVPLERNNFVGFNNSDNNGISVSLLYVILLSDIKQPYKFDSTWRIPGDKKVTGSSKRNVKNLTVEAVTLW